MNVWMQLGWIALGGACGAIIRAMIAHKAQQQFSSAIPYGTLTVNLSGSFLLGALWGMNAGEGLWSFAGVGLLGAFTTFSTLKLEFIRLHSDKKRTTAWQYLAISYIGGIVLAAAGYVLAQW